eukprot:scaffold8750_cov60-Attheya_sp.AAC.1
MIVAVPLLSSSLSSPASKKGNCFRFFRHWRKINSNRSRLLLTTVLRFAEQLKLAASELKPPSGRPKPEFVLRDLLVSFRRRLVPGPRRKFEWLPFQISASDAAKASRDHTSTR